MHTGIGLRQPHVVQALEERPPLAFVEVHAENFFGDGGAALAVLQAARERWPLSLHGVGLSLGSAAGIDVWHLDRLARLVERFEPLRVSDHAAFARAPRRAGRPPLHAGDLLPLAFNEAALDILVRNVQQVQERLKRPLLVEHLSQYLHWADDTMSEPAFFGALARRSGCALLLDVNNLVVNALNDPAGGDDAVAAACRWIDAIDPAIVGEIHLAGHADGRATGGIVIDDHGSRVQPETWRVFRHALARLGPRPTLVEWDTALPALDVLLDEAAKAEAIIAAAGPGAA